MLNKYHTQNKYIHMRIKSKTTGPLNPSLATEVKSSLPFNSFN